MTQNKQLIPVNKPYTTHGRIAALAQNMTVMGETDMGELPYPLAHKFHEATVLIWQILAYLEKDQ